MNCTRALVIGEQPIMTALTIIITIMILMHLLAVTIPYKLIIIELNVTDRWHITEHRREREFNRGYYKIKGSELTTTNNAICLLFHFTYIYYV